MNKLNEEELNILYFNFIHYRDNICNGWAQMCVQDFYKYFGLEPYNEDKLPKYPKNIPDSSGGFEYNLR